LGIAVGLVGFGLSGRVLHTPLILRAGMRIVGVVTRQEAAVQAAIPGARALPDLEALLALPRLDLVVIATPNHLHCPQALAALEAGKHVVVDKPLALSTLQADRLIAAAERAQRKLAVFQNRRWDSDFLTIRRILAQGLLGPVVAFEARWDRFRPLIADRWRERADCGGGLLYDLGSHLIDQALCLFGMPGWLQAQLWRQRAGAAVDDGFEIQMGQGTRRLSIASSSLAADHAQRYRIHGLQGSYRKTGLDVQEQQLRDGLSPSDPAFGVEPYAQWGQLVRGDSNLAEPVAAEGGRWLEFYRGVRRSLEQDSAVPVSAEEARRVLALIETARRSSEQAHRIALDGTAALQ